MSELNKFEASSDFQQKLKEFLLKDRHVPLTAKATKPFVEERRYSFDLDEDLQKEIKAKLAASGKTFDFLKATNKMDAVLENEANEDSFLALEMICNKTASDPESTLFHYMHSDCKEKVLENAVKRHSQEKHLRAAMDDMTQLDDVEAPSVFWDDTVLPTSPVKMVGLMRPSTIVEDEHENETLMCGAPSCYETAADTTSSTQAKAQQFYSIHNSLDEDTVDVDLTNDSVIEILSDAEEEEPTQECEVSMSFLNISNTTYTAKEKQQTVSPKLNDTLDEIDYMIKQGMALHKAQQVENQLKITPKSKNKIHLRANKENNDGQSPSYFKLNLKPPPFELFKKPLGSASKANTPGNKLHTSKKYDHIISPISVYVKHGANNPLISSMKPHTTESGKKKNSVFRNLDRNDFFDSAPSTQRKPIVYPGGSCLPKKAYISSNLKHVVDARTPVTIPGGNSIQQYIQPALMPAVVKHHGKMQLHQKLNNPQQQQHQLVDESLKDFSIINGDVSLCTIQDAVKF